MSGSSKGSELFRLLRSGVSHCRGEAGRGATREAVVVEGACRWHVPSSNRDCVEIQDERTPRPFVCSYFVFAVHPRYLGPMMAKSTKPSIRKRASKKSVPAPTDTAEPQELVFKLPQATVDPTLEQLARGALFGEPTLAEIDSAWD